MSVSILGLGTALPTHNVAQREAAEIAKTYSCHTSDQKRLLPVLYRRTQVQRRSSVVIDRIGAGGIEQSFFPPARTPDDPGPTTRQRMERYAEEAPALATRACEAAMCESATPPAAISHVITVTCTGFFAPATDVVLIKRLGLSPSVGRTQVGFMGCHGAVNGLRVASALAAQRPDTRVLLCAIELCSLHYQYGWNPDLVVANALFADGSAAVVLGHSESSRGIAPTRGEHSDGGAWTLLDTGSCLLPDCEDAMGWRISDNGFEMTLSARVPELINTHLRPWMEAWLSERGLRLGDVGSWAIHPGGPRIIENVANALQLPDAKTAVSRGVLADCGNMSSPTLLFILDRLRKANAPRPCVGIAFGPGLVAEAALFG
jgi:prepilin-type processing-associated H-X9-DG protein